jgi:UDP-N-acetylmuramate dehydrogenase
VYDPVRDRIFTLTSDDLSYSYRKSALQSQRTLAVIRATLSLTPTPEDTVRSRIREVVHRRATTQPLAMPSAGSAFLRPCESVEVWRLVDACGLRGFRIGGACVSEKHAGFIVNCGGATARDVRALMDHIRASVLSRHGLSLIPEICIFE